MRSPCTTTIENPHGNKDPEQPKKSKTKKKLIKKKNLRYILAKKKNVPGFRMVVLWWGLEENAKTNLNYHIQNFQNFQK